MNNEKISVELTNAEALVLFELLARFTEDHELGLEHPAEKQALLNLYSRLEGGIVASSVADYDKLLAEARVQVQLQE